VSPISSTLITTILWVIIVLLIIVVLALITLLFRRILLLYWDRYAQKRKLNFEPLVLCLLEDPHNISPLKYGLRPFDKSFIEELLLQQAEELKGQQRSDMTSVFEQLGYVAGERKRIRSKVWWRRHDAAIKLGIMRSKDAVPDLVSGVSDSYEIVRLSALRALGQMEHPESVQALLRVLRETEKWTGAKVLEVLVGVGEAIRKEVLSLLQSVTEPRRRLLLIELCGIMKWPESASFLIHFLDDPNPETRISTASALASIGDPAAAEHLVKALEDSSWEVRAQAAKGLGSLQFREATAALLSSLHDSNWWVRYNAANSLYQQGKSGIDLLRKAGLQTGGVASGIAIQVLAEQELYTY
jgi:hypothetical protein